MPLLDHFHPPISERRTWEGFHGLWAATMVEKLNRDVLAAEYFADMQVHVGSQVEVDVATLTELETLPDPLPGVAIATLLAPVWTPPAAAFAFPTVFPDDIEVQIYSTASGATLVAAIELVSPGNKDRADTRRVFATKCAAYLTRGIGLIVVDIVTNRLANMHNELMTVLGKAETFLLPPATTIYAVAYRPSRQPTGDQVEVWPVPLTIGQSLPLLPLALRNAGMVPLDLEETYTEARRRSRIAVI